MRVMHFADLESEELFFEMCTGPLKCFLFFRDHNWEDRWELVVWRFKAVADVEIYVEAGFLQGSSQSDWRRFSLGWKKQIGICC